ncbi:MAG: 1-deoxy-D-xylulose-5-phosphate synthase [Lachnospiraceae bacterium]|nr:1-deoxy-D-xylulose-5-phosphate synthase [Lachnospiraceae bacterium]
MILDEINNPNDIKKIDKSEYKNLAREIRSFIVKNVSNTGGHLASNLGVVELTMALHLVADLPKDKIIFDVGHQCYTHKILTGRKDEFSTLRQTDGISGFPKRCESDCDTFDTGHSSTSISLGLGLVKARELLKTDEKIFTIIGDGALSGGMAFEALNNAQRLKSNMVIVINDNQMSISKNVGGMASYLGKIRTDRKYTNLKENIEGALLKVPHGDVFADGIRGVKDLLKRMMVPGMLFEDMGITYIGPIDGHDVEQVKNALESALKLDEAVIVHVCTKKGKGYKPAEKHPSIFHGVDSFDVKEGITNAKKKKGYSEAFGDKLVEMADEDERIVAVSAAMPTGTGLVPMIKAHPDRVFDVGIAEEHAVTFAAGMARKGLKPFVAIYSTFFQRAYDQMISDVCLQNLPVTFVIDRAGLVGRDGETHQGIFDISYTNHMPGLISLAPRDKVELEMMLEYARDTEAPVAIRYPRGEAVTMDNEARPLIEKGTSEIMCDGEKVLILSVGTMTQTAMEARKLLKKKGLNPAVVNARFIKPLDTKLLKGMAESFTHIFTLEEGVLTGGFGREVMAFLEDVDRVKVHNIGLPEKFIEHAAVPDLMDKYGLTPEKISETILENL